MSQLASPRKEDTMAGKDIDIAERAAFYLGKRFH